jgi:NAD(P)-dependent dehydrogenase (short-subunit alcohol dehydrogenase family)
VRNDATNEADWVEAVGTAVNRYGKLDILANNAGSVIRKGIEDTSEADWDRIMAVNAMSVRLLLTRSLRLAQPLQSSGSCWRAPSRAARDTRIFSRRMSRVDVEAKLW